MDPILLDWSGVGLEHLRQLHRPGRVLHPERGAGVFDHHRDPITGSLAAIASHWWWVRWEVPDGRPFRQQVLSDPVLHLTFEDGSGPMHGHDVPAPLVHGVVPKVFEVDLPARGRVTGLACRPGGLAALLGLDAAALTGRVVRATDLFGPAVEGLAAAVIGEPDEIRRRDLVGGWLEHLLPAMRDDAGYPIVRRACELVEEGDFSRIDDLADAVHVSARTLQRLFPRLVGVPPLWVIRRRRLQRVAERLDAGETTDLSQLAADLAYSDQAHLSRDFRAVLGQPPSAYRRG